MRDKLSIERVKKLHPAVAGEVALLIEKAESKLAHNMAVRIVQGKRSWDEQMKLYNQGRTTKGKIVTNAKPEQTYHFYGLAIDYCLLIDRNGDGVYDEVSWSLVKDLDNDKKADWYEVKDVFQEAGWLWGGSWRTFKDYPHLEKTFGLHWKEMARRFQNEEFIPGTTYIRL